MDLQAWLGTTHGDVGRRGRWEIWRNGFVYVVGCGAFEQAARSAGSFDTRRSWGRLSAVTASIRKRGFRNPSRQEIDDLPRRQIRGLDVERPIPMEDCPASGEALQPQLRYPAVASFVRWVGSVVGEHQRVEPAAVEGAVDPFAPSGGFGGNPGDLEVFAIFRVCRVNRRQHRVPHFSCVRRARHTVTPPGGGHQLKFGLFSRDFQSR